MSAKGVRQARPQKHNNLGEVGRITGVVPPKNVARDSIGMEDASAYFGSPASAKAGKHVVRRERPDLHAQTGQVGRKTGIQRKQLDRDQHGFEDPNQFFASSPTSLNNPNQDEDDDDQSMEIGRESVQTPRGALRANEPNTSINRPKNLLNRSIPRNSSASRSSAHKFPKDQTQWNEIPSRAHEQDGWSDEGGPARPKNSRLSKLSLSTTKSTARKGGSPGSVTTSGGAGGGSRRTSFGTPTSGAHYGSAQRVDKGKGRAISSPEIQQAGEMEDFGSDGEQEEAYDPNFANGLEFGGGDAGDHDQPQRVEVDSESSEEEEMEEMVVQKKQKVPAQSKKRRAPSEADHNGVRRSSRQKVEPLDHWRNERIIYQRRTSGIGIAGVVRIPREPVEGMKRRAKSRARSERVKSEGVGLAAGREDEEGVDALTLPDGVVWSYEGDAEQTRRIAFTAKMVQPQLTYNKKFSFQKVFTDLDFLAAGILLIPAGTNKPRKPAKDNSLVFFCIEGAVSVLIHRTRFAIGPGGMFFIPRGNSYEITSTSERDVKLFFSQGRRVFEAEDGTVRFDRQEDYIRAAAEGEEEGGEEEDEGREME